MENFYIRLHYYQKNPVTAMLKNWQSEFENQIFFQAKILFKKINFHDRNKK